MKYLVGFSKVQKNVVLEERYGTVSVNAESHEQAISAVNKILQKYSDVDINEIPSEFLWLTELDTDNSETEEVLKDGQLSVDYCNEVEWPTDFAQVDAAAVLDGDDDALPDPA